MAVLYVNNDNLVVLTGLQDADTYSYVNSATLKFTLYSEATYTTAVSGASALDMEYKASSNGIYRATVPGTVVLTDGAKYYGKIYGTGAWANIVEWRGPMLERYRRI